MYISYLEEETLLQKWLRRYHLKLPIPKYPNGSACAFTLYAEVMKMQFNFVKQVWNRSNIQIHNFLSSQQRYFSSYKMELP